MSKNNQLAPLKSPAPAAYGFQRLPDEGESDYQAFMAYCESDHDFPASWIDATGSSIALALTESNAWISRRDQYYQWKMGRLRQKYVTALDRALADMEARRPYLLKRIEWARNIEGVLAIVAEDMEDEAEKTVRGGSKVSTRIGYGYDKAVKVFNADVEMQIKVLYALSSTGGVTINNINAAIGQDVNQVSRVAEAWGPVSRPASGDVIDGN